MMGTYKRILCAVDLSDDSRAITAKAVSLANVWQAELRLLHVVDLVLIEPMSDLLVPVVQIDDQTVDRAREQLQQLANNNGLSPDSALAVSGNVKTELLRQAREWQADLIVLGSRERHGLSILVNLTEDTVLHGASCDVLAVRVR